jgi:PEP-CTERM motif
MRKALFALLAAALIHPLTAHADTTDLFTITGDANTYTFTLPQQFTFPVSLHLVTVPTLTTTGSIDGVGGKTFNVTFFTSIGDPGDSLTFNDITLAGPPLISFVSSSGTPGNSFDTAAINPGSYQLIDLANSIKAPDYYRLTIAPETAPPNPPAVPEPTTFLLLATGTLGLLVKRLRSAL